MGGRDGHARTLWCLWGALLGAMPCVLRSPVVSLFSVSALVAPLQFQVEPLAAALSAVVLIEVLREGRASKRAERVLRMACPVVACVTVPLIVLSEVAWLPMRLGDYSLLAWQPVFELVGNVALTLSLVGWVLFGTCLGDAFAPSGVMERRSLMLGLLLGGVCVPMLLFVVSLGLPAWGGLVLCVASGILSWCVYRQISLTLGGISGFLDCALVLLGGLYASSALCRALSDVLLYHPVNFPDADPLGSACIVMLGVASVALVLCVAVAYVRKRWCAGEDLSPRVQPHEAAVCDLLPLLPGGDSLSARQRDVIALRLKGMKGVEVAKELGIGRGTVSTFQRRALDALGFESLDQLSFHLETMRDKNVSEGTTFHGEGDMRPVVLKALPVTLTLLPLVATAPLPYQETALLIVGATLVVVALAQMSTRDERLWGRCPVGSGARSFVLTCACAQSLGCLISVNYGGLPWGFVNVALSEFLICFTALREGIAQVFRFRPDSQTHQLRLASCLGIGLRLLCVRCPAFLLLVGSGLSSHRAALLNTGLQEGFFVGAVLGAGFSFISYVRQIHKRTRIIGEGPIKREAGLLKSLEDYGLTETEARVVVLVFLGMSRSQIAHHLCIAQGTVNGAKATAYRKLGVHSSIELRKLLKKSAG